MEMMLPGARLVSSRNDAALTTRILPVSACNICQLKSKATVIFFTLVSWKIVRFYKHSLRVQFSFQRRRLVSKIDDSYGRIRYRALFPEAVPINCPDSAAAAGI